MDTNSPPPLEVEPPPATSLAGRLANIIVAPGEVFDEIGPRPVATANWLVPLVLLILAGWIGAAVINSQAFAERQMTAMQERGLQSQVDSGKMSLVVSAEAPPEALFTEGEASAEFQRTVSRLHEMQSAEYLRTERRRTSGEIQGIPADGG